MHQEIVMENTHIIALTHRQLNSQEIGRYHLSDERRDAVLHHIKIACGLKELMYLSTCNRVEYIFVTNEVVDTAFVTRFFTAFLILPKKTPLHTPSKITKAILATRLYVIFSRLLLRWIL